MKLERVPRKNQVPLYIRENEFLFKTYKQVCQELLDEGLLYTTTLPLIQAYATSLYQYQCITVELLSPDNPKADILYVDKNQEVRQHPLTRVQSKYLDAVKTTAMMLGITPNIRAKRTGVKKQETKTRTLSTLGKAL